MCNCWQTLQASDSAENWEGLRRSCRDRSGHYMDVRAHLNVPIAVYPE